MLAIAAAAQGHIPIQILILLGAVVLALFARFVIKFAIALIVILVAIVIIKGDLALFHLFHLLRLLIP